MATKVARKKFKQPVKSRSEILVKAVNMMAKATLGPEVIAPEFF